jgi:hypothetical protein
MVKFSATTATGSKLIGLGLTEENMEHLRAGKPIHVDLREVNLPFDVQVLVFAGKDDEALRAMLQPLIGSHTIINEPKSH